jgi:predicted amidophosphoribosyltransferase
LIRRGFNQSALLAKILSDETGIPLDEQSLKRNAHTIKYRAAMDKRARAETVENAFEVKRARLISGETILLIDDVLTSGATASACARALKETGAAKVYVLTVARAF